jgi:DNA-binding MarR family transcriptional regulator
MNRTVELVMAWSQFEEKFKEGTIEEFCRHYLTNQREKKETGQNFRGAIPPQPDAYMSKLLSRIVRMLAIYSEIALREIPEVSRLEDFYFLNSIDYLKEPRKTDIISHNFMELSSGIDILNRLLRLKLIEERPDPADKRARLVTTTAKGKKLLTKCYENLARSSEVMFWDLEQEDKKLCIQLLKGVEIRHSKLVHEMKGLSIDQVHEKITGVKVKKH